MLTGQPSRVRTVYNRVRLGFDRPRPLDFDLNSIANRIRNLKDNNALLRRRAAAALATYGPEAKEAIPPLIETLDDQDADVSLVAVNALVSIGNEAQPALVKALHHSKPRVRAGAWSALTRMGPAAKTVLPDVLAILSNPKEESLARQSAARAVAAIGMEASDAIPALLDALKDADDPLRNAAALALPAIGPENGGVVKGLAAALRDAKFPQGELGAAQALRSLGPRARNAIPDLMAVSENATYTTDVRAAAVYSFAEMGVEARPAVKRLAGLLRDGGQPEKLRIAVAQTLGLLRTEGKPALAALNEVLRDPNSPGALSAEATRALAPMEQEGLQVLILLVNEGNTTAQVTSIQLLQNLVEGAKSAIPALMEAAAQDKDPEVRRMANNAARSIQAGGSKARGRMPKDD
jgi:HEAT repeat protein